MRKITFILTSIIVLTACTTLSDKRNGSFGLADHLKKITNIDLPKSITLIHEYDTGEGQAEALYNIDKSDLKLLTRQYRFSHIDSLLRADLLKLNAESRKEYLASYGLRYNEDEKYKLYNFPNITYFNICKSHNSFTLMADTNKTYLWLKISYPDMGGDGPECD